MRRELLQKVMAKLDSVLLEVSESLAQSSTDFSKKRKTRIMKDLLVEKTGRARMEEMYRKVPDQHFEKIMLSFDNIPREAYKTWKESLRHTPKDPGGRPSKFPLEFRRQLVQEVRLERVQCDILRDVIDIVAKRHKISHGDLRTVWKNRKRLDRT